MSENTVVITESGGKYQIKNNGISEFALLGILECIVFEMTSTDRQQSRKKETPSVSPETVKEIPDTAETISPEPVVPKSNVLDLRTRIGNAVKAIKGLGGEVSDFDVANATDEELQGELEALTEQYKRLKNSKGTKK